MIAMSSTRTHWYRCDPDRLLTHCKVVRFYNNKSRLGDGLLTVPNASDVQPAKETMGQIQVRSELRVIENHGNIPLTQAHDQDLLGSKGASL